MATIIEIAAPWLANPELKSNLVWLNKKDHYIPLLLVKGFIGDSENIPNQKNTCPKRAPFQGS
jgi:hypothetical protein